MKHWTTAIAFAATVGLLGACAAQGTSPTAAGSPATEQSSVSLGADVLTGALAAAREAGSARINGTVSTTTPQRSGTATISGVQSFDPAAMDLTVSSEMFAAGAPVRQVLLDGQVYVQVPELADKWLRIDPSQFAGLANPQIDPELLGDITGLQADGSGSVDGVPVKFYRADIDLDDALAIAGLPAEKLDQVRQRFDAEAGSANARFAIDWDGRLVGWTLDAGVNLADGGTMTSTADIRWSDFGVATEIRAPEPGLIVDPGALAGLIPQG